MAFNGSKLLRRFGVFGKGNRALVDPSTNQIFGGLNLPTQTLTATGAIDLENAVVNLSHATTLIAATLAAPPNPATAGAKLLIIRMPLASSADHTVTLPSGVTFNGTNRIATFADVDDCLVLLGQSTTRWQVLVNIGSVAFS